MSNLFINIAFCSCIKHRIIIMVNHYFAILFYKFGAVIRYIFMYKWKVMFKANGYFINFKIVFIKYFCFPFKVVNGEIVNFIGSRRR
jgi:hypothetical protein